MARVTNSWSLPLTYTKRVPSREMTKSRSASDSDKGRSTGGTSVRRTVGCGTAVAFETRACWDENRAPASAAAMAMAEVANSPAVHRTAPGRDRRPPTGPVVEGGARDSSRSTRASPMSRSRFLRSFARQRSSTRRTLAGRFGGNAVQSGSRLRIVAIVSETVAPANACSPVTISYSTQPNAPYVRALVDGLPPRLLGAHIRWRAEHQALARAVRGHGAGVRQFGLLVGHSGHDLRETEVEHLHDPASARS